MRKLATFLICVVIIYGCKVARKTTDKQPEKYTTAELVKILSSDEFEGRMPGEPGFVKASQLVEAYLTNLGVAPFFANSYHDSVMVNDRTSHNIVGVIKAATPTDEYILIGAHLDHVGKSDSEEDSVFNGANDNASGVTAVLKIAEALLKQPVHKNVLITIFTEEESGLNGAWHLAKRLKDDSVDLKYVINFEMLGQPLTSDSTKVYITGFNRSNLSGVANELLGYDLIKSESVDMVYGLFRAADNYPFYMVHKIPAHTVCTFDFKNYPYYHHLKDEYDKLDVEFMDQIIQKCAAMVVKLSTSDAEVKLTE